MLFLFPNDVILLPIALIQCLSPPNPTDLRCRVLQTFLKIWGLREIDWRDRGSAVIVFIKIFLFYASDRVALNILVFPSAMPRVLLLAFNSPFLLLGYDSRPFPPVNLLTDSPARPRTRIPHGLKCRVQDRHPVWAHGLFPESRQGRGQSPESGSFEGEQGPADVQPDLAPSTVLPEVAQQAWEAGCWPSLTARRQALTPSLALSLLPQASTCSQPLPPI